jgi:uncharacterized membrane protein YuzA (DUF378 family)
LRFRRGIESGFVAAAKRGVEGSILMKPLDLAALVLVLVGALNWGLWAAFKFDLVAALLGDYSMLARVVYGLVGIAAIVLAARLPVLAKLRTA